VCAVHTVMAVVSCMYMDFGLEWRLVISSKVNQFMRAPLP